jgi:hypothetical protein
VLGYTQLEGKLRELNGCTIQYKLFNHDKLLKLKTLISENSVLGRYVNISTTAIYN